MTVHVQLGDSLEVLRRLPADSISAVVTDPPYGLGKPPDMVEVLTAWLAGVPYVPKGKGFMGQEWDAFVPGPELWREVFRVMKPGAHAAVFAGTRTQDVMGLALRLAGFEIRDSVAWLYGSGFPKSLDVSKAIDASMGAERPVVGSRILTGNAAQTTAEKGGTYASGTDSIGVPGKEVPITAPGCPESAAWAGWGTALKPGHEPILIVRKPLPGTVAANVLTHGTGGIHVDAGRIAGEVPRTTQGAMGFHGGELAPGAESSPSPLGRWPANVALDEATAADLDETVGNRPGMSGGGKHPNGGSTAIAFGSGDASEEHLRADNGGPSRFFYCPKASRSEREAGLTAANMLCVCPKKVGPSTAGADRVTSESLSKARGPAVCPVCHRLQRVPSAGDLVGRETGAPGTQSPRAGAGRQSKGRLNLHNTVKPVALMQWLLRLLVPPGGVVLDPFGGSGTTGIAAVREGFDALLIEREAPYVEIAKARIAHAMKGIE